MIKRLSSLFPLEMPFHLNLKCIYVLAESDLFECADTENRLQSDPTYTSSSDDRRYLANHASLPSIARFTNISTATLCELSDL